VKFLVIWKLDLSLLSPHVAAAVARMPAYAKPLERTGQVAARYHIVGAHGGAWVYDVGSNSELERLIALMPIYNFAHYTIYPLADMPDWDETGAPPGEPSAVPAQEPAAGRSGEGPAPPGR
jgi:muconolactone delta-isomerase